MINCTKPKRRREDKSQHCAPVLSLVNLQYPRNRLRNRGFCKDIVFCSGDRSGVSKSLVTAAKSLGSKDNISVVVAWLDMSTLENGHFGQEPEVDVTDDILLPSVLRNLKPSPQITSGKSPY
ncbi:unnamed protein product [Nezara viridula]|uniref:Uncharacterized protein n=1 Tax=Nezara viridula TaxID=85310 RepID=A0A9P0MUJ0_NEZVI|nr:unnamed protein product [Nezara viridula]